MSTAEAQTAAAKFKQRTSVSRAITQSATVEPNLTTRGGNLGVTSIRYPSIVEPDFAFDIEVTVFNGLFAAFAPRDYTVDVETEWGQTKSKRGTVEASLSGANRETLTLSGFVAPASVAGANAVDVTVTFDASGEPLTETLQINVLEGDDGGTGDPACDGRKVLNDQGICVCPDGYELNSAGVCEPVDGGNGDLGLPRFLPCIIDPNTTCGPIEGAVQAGIVLLLLVAIVAP